MTFQRLHEGACSDNPTAKSLRERALAAFAARRENHDSRPSNESEFSTEEGLRAIHELQVHQIELEMQNEELRQSYLALEDSRQRYLDLYDRAPVGYCLVSAEGLIQDVNRALAEMLGIAPGSLLQQRFSKFICEEDQDKFYVLRRRVFQSHEPLSCELRLIKSEVAHTWVQLSVSLAEGDIETASLRVVILDIDARIRADAEKKSLEAQLRESQKMEAMGTLAGGIAHDFNNILAVILSNAELARTFVGDSETPIQHCVGEIQKAGERARDLVKQLLAFCRRQPTDLKSIALEPVIEDSIRLIRSTIPARVSVSFTHSQQVPNVLADFNQIEQVIINLANNSVQAMNGKPGWIKIHLDTVMRTAVTRDGGPNTKMHQPDSVQFASEKWLNYTKLVRLTFSDNGPGMESTVLDKIFEPFFTTKSAEEGTGLGLAVVHGIILTHGGEITVESQPGHGAKFTIYFPPVSSLEKQLDSEHVVASADLESLPTIATIESPNAPTNRILYIDDDEMVLQSIVNLLGHYGMQVHGYSNQLTALAALRASTDSFDLVVTDYNMPGLSGLDIAYQVREINKDLPVIVTSGFIDEELHAHANEAGVKALIPKPFSAKYFLDLLKDLFA